MEAPITAVFLPAACGVLTATTTGAGAGGAAVAGGAVTGLRAGSGCRGMLLSSGLLFHTVGAPFKYYSNVGGAVSAAFPEPLRGTQHLSISTLIPDSIAL